MHKIRFRSSVKRTSISRNCIIDHCLFVNVIKSTIHVTTSASTLRTISTYPKKLSLGKSTDFKGDKTRWVSHVTYIYFVTSLMIKQWLCQVSLWEDIGSSWSPFLQLPFYLDIWARRWTRTFRGNLKYISSISLYI